MVNAWLLYKRRAQEEGAQTMGLADFRIRVGSSLCLIGPQHSSQRGRKSDIEKELAKKKCSSMSCIPPKDVRRDETSHRPVYMDTHQRCKYSKCTGFSFIKCKKCSAALCLNKNKNCFKNFHCQ
ncbi:hypothetical protein NQ314_011228 [Rhamnusium bicolor]|uniref:Uncharacterized protein n=1 Tax=Rhamnusium bicolor TaxID=1586634 RepID=A0AAV8XKM7_9CUCU|nr:hypothetical protein NQ314_011228 [Rhamnusium bicolor]